MVFFNVVGHTLKLRAMRLSHICSQFNLSDDTAREIKPVQPPMQALGVVTHTCKPIDNTE